MNLRLVFMLFLPLFNYAQGTKEINGVLLRDNLPLSGCFVQAIGQNSNYTIAFDVTNNKGEFSINIDNKYEKVRIVITHLEFQPIDTLIILEKDSTFISFDIIKKQFLLPNVQVSAKKSIEVDGDTTTYYVESLKKNEKTIEELLSKLPGFEVNDNGEIKYKNKRITTILIDGDNVIQNDYKVLSRNLTPEMVDKIQAIENYSSNELLKGIEKGDETVLNLTINNNFRGIVFNKADLLSTLKDSLHELNNLTLNILPKLKVINVLNKNNINRNPKSINSSNLNNNAFKESTNPLLDVSYIAKLDQEDITRFNNQIYNSFNIFKKKKNKFETNIKYDYFNDKQSNYNVTSTSYLNVTPILNIDESQNNILRVNTHNAISSLKIHSSSSSFLRINVEKKYSESNYSKQLINSFNNQINTIFDTTNLFSSNVYFIKKINLKQVLEIESFYKRKNEKQRLSIKPEFNTIFFDSIYQKIEQQTLSKRNLFNAEARLKGNSNFLNYGLTFGFSKKESTLNSDIDLNQSLNTNNKDSLRNDALIITNEIYIFNKLEKKINNKVNLTLEQTINKWFIEYQPKTFSGIFYNPSILFKYKMDKFQNIDLSFKNNTNYIEEKYYLRNYYFNKYNTLIRNNLYQFVTEKKWEIESKYASINFFKNQRFILTSLNYSNRKSPIITQSFNNINFIIQRNQLHPTPLSNKSLVAYFFYSQLIPNIKSTFGLSSIYVQNRVKIIGKDNFLNDFTSNSSSFNLSVNSKFKELFNFEYKLGLTYNTNNITAKHPQLLSRSFDNTGYNTSIKLMSKFQKYLSANCKYSLITNNVTISILDFDIDYNIEKSNVIISLGGQNLFNNSSITVYNQNENFLQTNTSIIFPRFLYLKFLYKFSFKL